MIVILDYGSGNLRSAERAFATSGKEVTLSADAKTCIEAEGLIVPGVGAFQACMNGINAIGAAEIIQKRQELQRPTLGICIGMQILFSDGVENGTHKGIGMWQGEVSKIDAPILPHMGWNTVQAPVGSTLFKGLEEESFYFVHSYAAKKAVGKLQTWSTYGEKFLAAVEDGSLSATQFHPEKSGDAGLQLIKNWTDNL